MRMHLFIILIVFVMLSGCGGPSIYHWGHYEDLIYTTYIHPDKIDTVKQIELLNEDIQQAMKSGQNTPPGVHAHLGYLFYQQGNMDAAMMEFEKEKTNFQESSRLMDYMIRRIKND